MHRLSGIALFLGTAVLLYLLQLSLESEAGFHQVLEILDGTFAKLVLWVLLAALAYHFVAGIKHLLLDFGLGESKTGAKTGASITLALSFILIAILGVWIW